MARLVHHEDKGPIRFQIGTEMKSICACGLTKNKPFCDGSHRATRDEEEGKVYIYHVDRTRTEVKQ